MITLEKDIEGYLKSRVEKLGGLALKLPASLYRGIPDRMILLPGARVAFAETKVPGEEPRGTQRYWHRILKGLGVKVFVPKTKEDVEAMLNEIRSA